MRVYWPGADYRKTFLGIKLTGWMLRGLILIIALGIVTGVYFKFIHFNNHAAKKPIPLVQQKSTTASIGAIEKKDQLINSEKIANGDINDYQFSEFPYVESYISVNDYSSATRVLGEISSNVPTPQLDPIFYRYSALVAQHNGNTALYKQDMQQLIDNLRKAGRTKEADAWEKQPQGT
jgi:hypothetical protein